MSLMFATTIPPEKWSEIFKDESVAGAVAHRCSIMPVVVLLLI
jgi:hypothetical protein